MKVTIDLPDDVFWRLATRAEGMYGQRADEYLADLALSVTASRVPTETDPVLRLWRAGDPDREIARRLGMTNAQVAARRRRYGIPAHRRHRSTIDDVVATSGLSA